MAVEGELGEIGPTQVPTTDAVSVVLPLNACLASLLGKRFGEAERSSQHELTRKQGALPVPRGKFSGDATRIQQGLGDTRTAASIGNAQADVDPETPPLLCRPPSCHHASRQQPQRSQFRFLDRMRMSDFREKRSGRRSILSSSR